jgi:predicted O-methyltransferase YrrM
MLLSEVVGKVDFVKVDVEGAELQTLLGGRELIRRDRPWLLIEVHSVPNFLAVARLRADWAYVFTVVRHPDYERHSRAWRSHCWIAAQPVLHGPRLDWAEDETTARSSRRDTLRRALAHLDRRHPDAPIIVEVGTIRGDDDAALAGDGWSTYLFAAYASRHGGRVITIDRSAEALAVCRRVTAGFAGCIEYVVADAVKFLGSYRGPIDLLYLDGPYEDDLQAGRQAHLDFYEALAEPPELVLIDDVFSDADRGKGELLIPRLCADGYRRVFHEDRQALYSRPRELSVRGPRRRDGAMYIAANNCLERGYFLGDVLVLIKTARLFVANEPHGRIILSLHRDDPLNFLWDGFIRDTAATVVLDDWDRPNRPRQYEVLDRRRVERRVQGMPFATYKELYPRLDGGDRQRVLCGRENGLGRRNIFEYTYYGQEEWADVLAGSTDFGPDVIAAPSPARLTTRTAFLAPHEKCQRNRYFTLAFWKNLCGRLLAEGVALIVNDNGRFFPRWNPPGLTRSFLPFAELVEQIARQRLVVCGNTGIGWAAAATGTPFIALEKDLIFGEYSFVKCGCRSLVATQTEPDPETVAQAVLAFLDGSGHHSRPVTP